MTPTRSGSARVQALAFKAYEIEELADVWFFRPLGAVVARAAAALGLTPIQVTVAGGLVGMAAGALLYDESLAFVAFALLIVHSVIDSADGQLARMTGQVSELGRLLDGVGGYLTHAAIYTAIIAGVLHRGGDLTVLAWAAIAGVSNVVHAQLYDYHRQSYAAVAIRGESPSPSASQPSGPWTRRIVARYEGVQRMLVGGHEHVMAVLRARAGGGPVRVEDRERYRAQFYWLVRGWNVLGDNTRFYAIGLVAWAHHLDGFFTIVAVPMNIALTILWVLQSRADRRFLAAL
jgi:CDP-alcohol phosphatidyltransferase